MEWIRRGKKMLMPRNGMKKNSKWVNKSYIWFIITLHVWIIILDEFTPCTSSSTTITMDHVLEKLNLYWLVKYSWRFKERRRWKIKSRERKNEWMKVEMRNAMR
jgi:hypothetical protein